MKYGDGSPFPIEPILDHYGIQFRDERYGNQSILCPFHEDGRKSASVNLDTGLFHCFTCNTGCDAIGFIKMMEGVDFEQAKRLAQEVAGESDRQVSRGSGREDSVLPRKSGHRPGRRNWVSPWGRKRA